MRRFLPLLALVVLAACTSSGAPEKDPQGWTRYEGAKLGYSLALPPDWSVDEGENSLRYIGGAPTTVLSVFRSVEQFDTLFTALAARDQAAATGWEGQPSLAVKSTEKMQIGGQLAVERREEYLAAGLEAEATYFFHDGRLYGFSSRPDGADALTAEQVELHKRIMATVRWL